MTFKSLNRPNITIFIIAQILTLLKDISLSFYSFTLLTANAHPAHNTRERHEAVL